jgi:integrase
VLKRGFRTRREAAAVLRAQIRRTEVGEWVEPSKQRLDAYLAEWIAAQRLSPSALSSYRKNIRLHIDPCLGAQPVAALSDAVQQGRLAVNPTDRATHRVPRRPGRRGCRHGPPRSSPGSSAGRTPTTPTWPCAGGSWRPPGCAAGKRSRCAGATSTWTPPGSRHTHATLLLADGVPVKVVSERLGHANATITLTVYQHVHPGMGR